MACTEKQKALGRLYYWRNHDKRLAQMAHYRATHRAEKRFYNRVYGRQYRALHREEANARAREYARRKRLLRPPRVSRAMSREERLARQRAHRLVNRDRLLAYQRARYHANREREHLRGAAYRERCRAALREGGRSRYWRDHEANLERAHRYYETHKAQHAAKQKAYRSRPEVRARRSMLRRKRRFASFESHVKRVARQQARKRAYARKQSKQLTTAYVRRLLSKNTNLKPDDFPLAIVRLARSKLRLLRAVRQRRKEVTT